MSTALNSFWLYPKSTGLMSGDTGNYSYADLLEEQFGPARALNVEGLDELFEAVERMLTGEDRLDTDSPLAGAGDPA